MVQQISRLPLEALRIGQATSEIARIASTPKDIEVGFDLETTGLNPREHQLVMVQFKPKHSKALIIDARGEDLGALRDALLPLFRNSKRVFRGQNLIFDVQWLLSHVGFEVSDLKAAFSDIMQRELVILGLGFGDAVKRGIAVNMKALGDTYGIEVHKEERSWFIGLDQRDDWYHAFPQEILEYGLQDVDVVHQIAEEQNKLINEYGLKKVVTLESRVLAATAGMQHYGLSVDREKWLEIMRGIDEKAEELAEKLHEAVDVPVLEARRRGWQEKNDPYVLWSKGKDEFIVAAEATYPRDEKGHRSSGWGEERKRLLAQYNEEHPKPKSPGSLKDGVNLNSSDQILVAMRSRGHTIDSTDKSVLRSLAAKDQVVQLYLDWKGYQTARTKYGPAFLEEHAPDGTLYSTVQQVGTETGRFAFKEPNIQQIPARGAGGRLREAVVPRPGYIFVDSDFTNVELMILAWVSQDPLMLKAFNEKKDLHAQTAELMFGLRENQEYVAALDAGVTPKKWTGSHDAVVAGKTLVGTDYRSIAKTISFGLFYGMGANLLASQLRIDVVAAQELMRLYKDTYEVAVAWLKEQGERIKYPDKDERVFAATLLGRRRWFTIPNPPISQHPTKVEVEEWKERRRKQRAEIQRQLANHPIQGTSADITKYAIAYWQARYNSPVMRLISTIHDEILLEVENKPEVIELANTRLGECMHSALTHFLKDMNIPVPAGVVSDHWEH